MAHRGETIWLLIESGFAMGILSLCFWVGVQAKTVEAQGKQIDENKVQHQILAEDLVKTQKDILVRLTRIETLIDRSNNR